MSSWLTGLSAIQFAVKIAVKTTVKIACSYQNLPKSKVFSGGIKCEGCEKYCKSLLQTSTACCQDGRQIAVKSTVKIACSCQNSPTSKVSPGGT